MLPTPLFLLFLFLLSLFCLPSLPSSICLCITHLSEWLKFFKKWWQHQILVRMWRKWSLIHAAGNVNWYGNFGHIWQFQKKKKGMQVSLESLIIPLGIYPRELKTYWYKNLHKDAHSSLTCNNWKLETTYMSFSRHIVK